MSTRRCKFCDAVLYGRSDKQYCSSTCRRDMGRVRLLIDIRDLEVVGIHLSVRQEDALRRLEHTYGPNHRIVQGIRRKIEHRLDEEAEAFRRELEEEYRELAERRSLRR